MYTADTLKAAQDRGIIFKRSKQHNVIINLEFTSFPICNVCYYCVICENLVMNKLKTIFLRKKGIIDSKFVLMLIPILLHNFVVARSGQYIPCNHANTSPYYCLPCYCENLMVN